MGGRLNQVPDDSNSGLPMDVTADLAALGVVPCQDPLQLVRVLETLLR